MASGIVLACAQLINAADASAQTQGNAPIPQKQVASLEPKENLEEAIMGTQGKSHREIVKIVENISSALQSPEFTVRNKAFLDTTNLLLGEIDEKNPPDKDIFDVLEKTRTFSNAEEKYRYLDLANAALNYSRNSPTRIPVPLPASVEDITRAVTMHCGISIQFDESLAQYDREIFTELPDNSFIEILESLCFEFDAFPRQISADTIILLPQDEQNPHDILEDKTGFLLTTSTFTANDQYVNVEIITDPQVMVLGFAEHPYTYGFPQKIRYFGNFSTPDNYDHNGKKLTKPNESISFSQPCIDCCCDMNDNTIFNTWLGIYCADTPREYDVPLSDVLVPITATQSIAASWNAQTKETNVRIHLRSQNGPSYPQDEIAAMNNRYTLLDEKGSPMAMSIRQKRYEPEDTHDMRVVLRSDTQPSSVRIQAYKNVDTNTAKPRSIMIPAMLYSKNQHFEADEEEKMGQ